MGECCGNGCQRGGCDFDLDYLGSYYYRYRYLYVQQLILH